MLINILITIVSFFVLLYISVNLLGFLVRGLFRDPELDRIERDTDLKFLKDEIVRSKRADHIINVFALIFTIGFFYVLLHFWNVGVLAVSVLIMIGRLPFLLWEIKHGKKAERSLMKKSIWYDLASFLPWIGLPLLYFSLY